MHDLSAPSLPLLWKGKLVCPGRSGSNGRGADGRGGRGVGESGRFGAHQAPARALHVHGDDMSVMLLVENALRRVSELEINRRSDKDTVVERGVKSNGGGGRCRAKDTVTLRERYTKSRSDPKLI